MGVVWTKKCGFDRVGAYVCGYLRGQCYVCVWKMAVCGVVILVSPLVAVDID